MNRISKTECAHCLEVKNIFLDFIEVKMIFVLSMLIHLGMQFLNGSTKKQDLITKYSLVVRQIYSIIFWNIGSG